MTMSIVIDFFREGAGVNLYALRYMTGRWGLA